jgi:hypothetical protein
VGAMLEPRVVRDLVKNYRELSLEGSLALSIMTSVLGETPASDHGQAWQDYVALSQQVPEPIRERIDTCLTRYAANHLHTTPYMLSPNLLSYARDLIWRIAALRYLLTCSLSGYEGSASDVDRRLVEVVYRFGRRVEHSPFFAELDQLLEGQGLTTFAHTVGFLCL